MVQLFGFEIKRQNEEPVQSFAPEVKDDGAVVVAAGGAYGTYVDLDGTARTEAELVAKYRDIATQSEIEMAIDEIVNEAMDTTADEIVTIDVDNIKYGDNVKNRIKEEFDIILELFNFNNDAYELFRRWYVDGRMYYHIIIDEKSPRDGIKELRYVDPRKIRKVREVKRVRQGPAFVNQTKAEYYVYNDRSFLAAGGGHGAATSLPMDMNSTAGLRISIDSILHATSGLTDKNNVLVYSHLQKAIRPLNQLRTLEDATVIYRISRAPERRIFYIDVGNLPKIKAEQYLREMMVRHKNRLVYDASTGEVRDDRKYMTMLEDYWLPRREGNRGTEITTLPAGQNLGELEDVKYFQNKLYKSLNVPLTRLEQQSGFNIGKAAEISREEVKFSKFIGRLRKRFNQLFYKTLEKQLILKGIIAESDWKELSNDIKFKYITDSHFEELRDLEVLENRVDAINKLQPYIGKYFSDMYIRKNILKQTDEDIKQMQEEITQDLQNNPPEYDEQGNQIRGVGAQGYNGFTPQQIASQQTNNQDNEQQ
jgi:hypothetical protein